MKVLNTVYGDASGGRWQAFLDITNTLQSYGHTVILVRGTENQHLSSGDHPIHVIENTGFYSINAALKVRKFLNEIKPDIIIAHSGKAVWLFKNAMLGMKKRIPVIAVNHSHNVKRTIRADAFIHVTPHVQSLVQRLQSAKDLKNKPQSVISNLTYLPVIKADPHCFKSPVCIVMLTRMVAYKGVDVLINALAILKAQGIEYTAILAGQGEMLSEYKAQVENLGLTQQITFPGWVGGENKINLMQQADILALPSLSELQGIGILDAFAWGKTLITTDDIGIRQTAKHNENAWCTKAGDAQSLAGGLVYLITYPEEALRLAKQGKKEAVENYCFEQIAKQHHSFINQVYNHYK